MHLYFTIRKNILEHPNAYPFTMRFSENNDVVMMAACVVEESSSNKKRRLACHEGDEEGSSADAVETTLVSASTSQHDAVKTLDAAPVLRPHSSRLKKRVSWNNIQTREYSLVVGDHPLCQDGLPVSLDWQFSDSSPRSFQVDNVTERSKSYVFPRRLSYQERISKLCDISGFTLEEVKNEEIDLVVKTLKESWDEVPVEPITTVDSDPLIDDMMLWDDIPGLDCDLADVSDFEWTESL